MKAILFVLRDKAKCHKQNNVEGCNRNFCKTMQKLFRVVVFKPIQYTLIVSIVPTRILSNTLIYADLTN